MRKDKRIGKGTAGKGIREDRKQGGLKPRIWAEGFGYLGPNPLVVFLLPIPLPIFFPLRLTAMSEPTNERD
jgi:hypothetical protein